MRKWIKYSCCYLVLIFFLSSCANNRIDVTVLFPDDLAAFEKGAYASIFSGIMRQREVDAPANSDIEKARMLIREEDADHIMALCKELSNQEKEVPIIITDFMKTGALDKNRVNELHEGLLTVSNRMDTLYLFSDFFEMNNLINKSIKQNEIYSLISYYAKIHDLNSFILSDKSTKGQKYYGSLKVLYDRTKKSIGQDEAWDYLRETFFSKCQMNEISYSDNKIRVVIYRGDNPTVNDSVTCAYSEDVVFLDMISEDYYMFGNYLVLYDENDSIIALRTHGQYIVNKYTGETFSYK